MWNESKRVALLQEDGIKRYRNSTKWRRKKKELGELI